VADTTVNVAAAHLPGIVHELLLELVAEDDLADSNSRPAQVAALIEQITAHVHEPVTLSGDPPMLEELFTESLEHARAGLDEHDATIGWPPPLRGAEVYHGAALGAQSALAQLGERRMAGEAPAPVPDLVAALEDSLARWKDERP